MEILKTKSTLGKNPTIDHIDEAYDKLIESGKFKAFLPQVMGDMKFKINYEETQKIDFPKTLVEVLGTDGLSPYFLRHLMNWSKINNSKHGLQSTLAFPIDQFDGIFVQVVEKPERDINGVFTGKYIPVETYEVHLIETLVLGAISNIPNMYEIGSIGLRLHELEMLPEEMKTKFVERYPNFPNLNIVIGAGNENYKLDTIYFDVIFSKVPEFLKEEPAFQQMCIAENQRAIKGFFGIDVLATPVIMDTFISKGFDGGEFAIPTKYMNPELDLATKLFNARLNIINKNKNATPAEKESRKENAMKTYESLKNAYATRYANNNQNINKVEKSYSSSDYELRKKQAMEEKEKRKQQEQNNQPELEYDDEELDF